MLLKFAELVEQFLVLAWEPAVWWLKQLRLSQTRADNALAPQAAYRTTYAELVIDFEISTGTRLERTTIPSRWVPKASCYTSSCVLLSM